MLSLLRPALRRVNRVGIILSSPRWTPNPTWSRPLSSLGPESTPKSPAQVATATATPTTLPPLQSPPEPSTTPLESESDFSKYLEPLNRRGWSLIPCEMPKSPGEETRAGFMLKRTFRFPSTKDLIAFSENTRNVSQGSVAVLFKTSAVVISFRSTMLTRGLIQSANEADTEYQKIVGREFGILPVYPMTPSKLETILKKWRRRPREKRGTEPKAPTYTPITPVTLPPAPPAPVLPVSITEADLKTYIKPLVTNGWSIGSPRTAESKSLPALRDLQGHPALRRIYVFHDYTSARQFFHAIVAASPASSPLSWEAFEIRQRSADASVEVWSISELPESAPKKYGISHADVRFAIAVETEFLQNWAGRTENTAISRRKTPGTMEELWSK